MTRSVDTDDNEQWAPVSDLMAALMLIFMFIAVIYIQIINAPEGSASGGVIATAEEGKNESEDYPVQVIDPPEKIFADERAEGAEIYSEECNEIYRELYREFRTDFQKWNARLYRNLTFRFSNPKVLFASGSDNISPTFKEILDDFFPRYMSRISLYHYSPENENRKNEVREIRIEGHTSSKWKDEPDEKKRYMNNMELSQNRTRAILEYVLFHPRAYEYDGWARPLITANGLSSSHLLDSQGKLVGISGGAEDATLSRRVEFRLLSSACDQSKEES